MLSAKNFFIAAMVAASVSTTNADVAGAARRYHPTEPPYEGIFFKRPFRAFDPRYYQEVFYGFKKCSKKCRVTKKYGSDAWDAFGTLADYTACVTSCVSGEVLNVAEYYRETYAKVYDVGMRQLKMAKSYIAGAEEFDMLGNRTRIDYSCCLPNEYFVDWGKIMVSTTIYHQYSTMSIVFPNITDAQNNAVMVRADYYLDYCATIVDTNPSHDDTNVVDGENGAGGLKINCDDVTFSYLAELKGNLGHVVIEPEHEHHVPDGACNRHIDCDYTIKPNPKAKAYEGDICVVEKTMVTNQFGMEEELADEDEYSYVRETIVVPVNETSGKCPTYEMNYWGRNLVVHTRKTRASSCDHYMVTGLPGRGRRGCNMKYNLGDEAFDQSPPSKADVECLVNYQHTRMRVPPSRDLLESDSRELMTQGRGPPPRYYYDGPVEYCNAKQFANHLTSQLYRTDDCTISHYEGDTATMKFDGYYNLACVYKFFSLKCDCMQAVMKCYELDSQHTSALGKTLGRASSILCGFILCQRTNVFRLFEGQNGQDHRQIMKEVLLQTGVMVSSHGLPVASIAFLSFGLGMVAFFVTKKVMASRKTKSTMEDGYNNLI